MKFYLANIILLILNSYVILRLAKYTAYYEHKWLLYSVIIFITILQDLVHLNSEWLSRLENLFSKKTVVVIYQVSYLAFGMMSCAFIYTAIMDILGITLNILPVFTKLTINFYKFYPLIIILLTLLTVIFGFIVIVKGPIIKKVEIVVKNLPAHFNNFKIVQLSDLHIGKIIKHDYVANVVNLTNSLKPNLIALTGDFVDGKIHELREDVLPLSHLQASHGIFFVTGNHEYYSGAKQWIEEFTNLGIKVLLNQHVIISNKGDEIILAGVTDYSTINAQSSDISDPNQALQGAPNELVKILLAHQPTSYIAAHKAGYNLQLSGHTHGGQYFPFTLLIKLFHRYYKGLNNHEGMWIYVNQGTGYWGPPLRLGTELEITQITLKSGT